MNISNRLYSYPVLSEETVDYQDKIFNVIMQYENLVDDLDFDFQFDLTSNSLQKLIKNKEAEFMIHVECSETSYRNAFRSFTRRTSFEIPLSKVNGTVNFVALIVATKNISKYSSEEWCEDFDGISFDIEKGSILAYQNLDSIDVTKDYEDFTDSSSIISITKKFAEQPVAADVSLEGNRIKIALYEEEYKEYYKKKEHNPELLPVLNSLIILPALVYAFSELKDEDNYQKYSGRNWLISLEVAFEKRGKILKDEVLSDENTSFSLAQTVMELPIGKSILQMNNLLQNEENEEEE